VLVIDCPFDQAAPRRWILQCLLQRFGLPLSIRFSNRKDWCLSVEGQSGSITMPDLCFAAAQAKPAAPADPAPWVRFILGSEELSLPVLFGRTEPEYQLQAAPGSDAALPLDIPGAAFWLMARIEERGSVPLDLHDRFSAYDAHAWRNGYLMIPVVDEYVRVLHRLVSQVWPGLPLSPVGSLSLFLSHDVDDPYAYRYMPFLKAAKLLTANAVKQRSPLQGLRWMLGLGASRAQIRLEDPCDTFDWLMAQSERANISSAFYFIASDQRCSLDSNYDIRDMPITALLRRIHQRGHEIGIHPGYECFRRPELIKEQVGRLRAGMSLAGINDVELGGRMHYLRWDQRVTPTALANAGLHYDSTLGYADHPGFRCGTCHPFPYFDIDQGVATNLLIRPLVAMECTVLAKRYLGLGATPDAFEVFAGLKQACRRVGGEFSLLWHNSFLFCDAERELYRAVIEF
jgi:hypothetical protein